MDHKADFQRIPSRIQPICHPIPNWAERNALADAPSRTFELVEVDAFAGVGPAASLDGLGWALLFLGVSFAHEDSIVCVLVCFDALSSPLKYWLLNL